MYYQLRRGSIAVGSTLLLTSDECAASGTASSTSSEYPVCVDGTGRTRCDFETTKMKRV